MKGGDLLNIRPIALALAILLLPSTTLAATAGNQCIFLLTDLACLFGNKAECGKCQHPPATEVHEGGGEGGGFAAGHDRGADGSGTDTGEGTDTGGGDDSEGGESEGGDDGPPGDGPPGDPN